MIAETHDECPVARRQHVVQECFQVMVMLLDKMLLAAADVNNQPRCQRNIRAAGEEGDRLRHAVLEHFKVVPGQIGGPRASRTAKATLTRLTSTRMFGCSWKAQQVTTGSRASDARISQAAYSSRSVSAGFSFAIRRAGSRLAAAATTSNPSTTAT